MCVCVYVFIHMYIYFLCMQYDAWMIFVPSKEKSMIIIDDLSKLRFLI